MRYLALLLVLCACEGPVGPEGPQGPVGPPGEGSVTVVDLHFADMEPTNGFASATVDVPEITEAVVSDGFVTAYLQFGRGEWQALPYTAMIDGSGDFETMFWHHTFAYDVGTFEYKLQYQPPDDDNCPCSGDVRVVIVH